MSVVPRLIAVGALLVALGAIARGEDAKPVDPPSAPPTEASSPRLSEAQAADAVLVAFKANDSATLKALAAKDAPDPWLVADELIGRAEPDAATSFAKAAPREDTKALPAYIAAHRTRTAEETRVYASCAAAAAALSTGDGQVALDRLEAAPKAEGGVAAIGREILRSGALRALGRGPEARAAMLAVIDDSLRLGWLAFAAQSLEGLGLETEQNLTSFAAVVELYTRLAPLQERRGDLRGQSRALSTLGFERMRMGQFDEAVRLSMRAVAIARQSRDGLTIAGALGNAGQASLMLRDFVTARSAMAESADLLRAAGNMGALARTRAALAEVLLATGELQQALRVGREASEALATMGDARGRMVADSTVVRVLRAFGSLADCLVLAESLRDEAQSLGVLDLEATASEALAGVHADAGESEEAIEIWLHVAEIASRLGNQYGVRGAHVSIASLRSTSGQLVDARKEATETLAQAQDAKDGDSIAACLGILGAISLEEGDFASDVQFQRLAIEVASRLKGGTRAAIARLNLSLAQLEGGHLAEARASAEAALAEAEHLGARDLAIGARISLARGKLRGADPTGALGDARRAVTEIAGLTAGLGPELGAGLRGRRADVYEIGTLAARDLKDVPSADFFLESSRANGLVEALGGQQALANAAIPPALLEKEAAARAQEAFTASELRTASAGSDLARTRAAQQAYDQARKDVVAIGDRIQREALASARLLGRVEPTLPPVQKALQPNECLVIYGVTAKESVALVVTSKTARLVDLGPSERIRAACRELVPDDSSAEDAGKAKALADLVVAPLGLDASAKRVLISPEDELSLVPFALLVPDREVVYVPSGTVYQFLSEGTGALGQGVLALGDPDYESGSNEKALQIYAKKARSGAGSRLPRLAATAAEVKAVGDVVLLQSGATEEGLIEALAKRPRWRAIHLACHGILDTERPMLSSLAVTASDKNDGFLTAVDVVRLKAPADLVVLSACETGKGKIVKGEGIVGLTRAFMFAGAPRVICSLWKVDDEATKALMVKFYELWNPKDGKPGLPTAEALRNAQEFVRSHEKWTHPYYWAAWVLWGLPS